MPEPDRTLPVGSYAYSLANFSNKLAIRARRSSDNAEIDLYAQEITDGKLISWAQGGNVFVTTRYDQGENNMHFTQTATASQPRIVNSGALETLSGGLPAINFAGAVLVGSISVTANKTFFFVHQPPVNVNTSGPFYYLLLGTNAQISVGGGDNGTIGEVTLNQTASPFNGYYNTSALAANTKYLDVHTTSLSPFKMRRNKSNLTVAQLRAGGSVGITSLIGIGQTAAQTTANKISEVIVFNTVFASTAPGSEFDQIESEIATYYGI